MLTIDQLVDLEVLISEEIERLRRESEATTEERAAIQPDVAIGRLSRLDAMQMQEMAKEAERRREDRIPRLELALERIDTGEYGICEVCRDWIPFDRLKLTPEATRCGKCAE
mgnify:CR=1 FL=1